MSLEEKVKVFSKIFFFNLKIVLDSKLNTLKVGQRNSEISQINQMGEGKPI